MPLLLLGKLDICLTIECQADAIVTSNWSSILYTCRYFTSHMTTWSAATQTKESFSLHPSLLQEEGLVSSQLSPTTQFCNLKAEPYLQFLLDGWVHIRVLKVIGLVPEKTPTPPFSQLERVVFTIISQDWRRQDHPEEHHLSLVVISTNSAFRI